MADMLLQAMIYLGAMVIAVPLSVRFGLGSVLGYLIAGIAIGPVLGLVGSETADLQHYAEFGVVLMLFLIGLELDPKGLWGMRQRLIGLGGAQIALSTLALSGGAMLLGLGWQMALAVGLTLSLSSTAIVLKTLNEKDLMRTNGGRSAFSVLLTQDIAVIPFLALLPLLAAPTIAQFAPDGSIRLSMETDGHTTLSLVEGLPAWGVTLVTLGAVAAVILAGRYLSPHLFRFIHMSRLREMYTAVALVIVVGIAVLMIVVGLSPALGAFVAGVVLANSEFRHELEADIEPFKGLLLGLFFITVGAGINFNVLFANPGVIIGLTLALMIIKGLILLGIAVSFGLKRGDRWLFTLGLAQAGEFGFVLVAFGLQQAVFPDRIAETMLLVIALSMLLTPLSFIAYEVLRHRTRDGGSGEAHAEPDDIAHEAPIIIAGIGRFGQVVNRMVQASGFKTVVLDSDLSMIQLMRRFGFEAYFGDPTRPELLTAAGLETAKVLVVAVDDRDAALRLVRYARRVRPDLSITARAIDRLQVYELFNAGADHIVREMFDSSLRAARYVLEDMGLSDYEAHELEIAFYRHDRQNLRALAEVWKPGVPVAENPEYVERSRELNAQLEEAIVSQLGEMAIEERESKERRAQGDAGALRGVEGLMRSRPTPRRPGGDRNL
ncbi:MAG: monovalent cation:proton antiporter-2 (CPA2) family protein [Pseudomonadota bacterium]